MKSFLSSCLRRVKADYLEIRYEEVKVVGIHYVGKELEAIGESYGKGGGIRAKSRGGWSFVSFNDLSKLKDYLELATKGAHLIKGEEIKLASLPARNQVISVEVELDPADISLEEKYLLCNRYNKILLSGKEIQTSALRYADIHTTKYFINSEGTYIEQERIDTVLGMRAIARRGDNIQSAHMGIGGVGGYGLVKKKAEQAEETVKRAQDLLDAEPAKGGKYTIIVDPELSGVFAHEAFGHLSEADFLYEDKRLQKIMVLGRVFGPPGLNIIDEPRIKGEGGYYLYDDEGVPSQKTYLIKEGRLSGRLHSRETSAKMGEEITGNARAISYDYPPIVRMSNTYIAAGDKSFEEMIEGVGEGIYVKGFRGGQTNLEMFTFAPEEGYLIKKGRLHHKIRDLNLSGNIFNTLASIKAIGSDLVLFTGPGGCGKGGQSPLPVSTGGPHLEIRDVVVGGK